MRFSRWVAAVFAIPACAAVVLAGSGGAAAALLTSTAYPHSQPGHLTDSATTPSLATADKGTHAATAT